MPPRFSLNTDLTSSVNASLVNELTVQCAKTIYRQGFGTLLVHFVQIKFYEVEELAIIHKRT
jgi:hypothetical protein